MRMATLTDFTPVLRALHLLHVCHRIQFKVLVKAFKGESIQDSCKTSNDVRCRDVGSEESTREEVGCGGNEDVKMDEWSHQDGQN